MGPTYAVKLFVSVVYIILFVALFCLCALAGVAMNGCSSPRPVSPTPLVIDDTDRCDEACGRLNELGCEDGRPVATGVQCVGDHDCREGDQCINRVCHSTCETFCRETQSWGVWLQPSCVESIDSCDHLDRCALSQ